MFRNLRILALLGSAAALLAGTVGCNLFGNNNASGSGGGGGTTTAIPPSFATTVVVGDSLSAGFENGSLLDSLEPNGWASLIAAQGNFSLPLPLIAPPGAPAVLQLESLGPPPVITQESGITTGRDNPDVQPYNLSVPGQTLDQAINLAPSALLTDDEDIITELILGFPLGNNKSQMSEAIALSPSAVFVWIGNDDALNGDEGGSAAAMTPLASFTSDFQQLLNSLHTQTKATLIVANIPDVTAVPYLTPAATVIAQVSAETGLPATQVATDLGIEDGDLVNATGLDEIQSAVTAIQQGQIPTPLTETGFLTPTAIAAIQAAVNQYNAAIAQEVTAVGGVLVDVHTFNANLAQNGITINNYHATNAFLGGLFGLDGLHPTNTGYALLANLFIDTMNSSLKTTIPEVNVTAVAAADPFFGPNIKPTGSAAAVPRSIPLAAARRADQIMRLHNRHASRATFRAIAP
jgi:hypothetical protein